MITEEKETKKLGLLPKIGIGLLLFLVLFYSYMHFLEPTQIEVLETPIINEKIPESFNGFKIVQFSDIHFGMTTNEKEVEKMVQKINECKPDIVVFTGDLFDPSIQISEKNITFLKETLSKIESNLGKYAIKGDQDDLDTSFEEIISSSGFKLLTNENIPIYYEGNQPIYLGGIPSISNKKEDFSTAISKEENAYQILIMHEPILFDEIKNSVDLGLAGHTLGGLIRIPFFKGLFPLDNTGNYEKGLYQKGSSTLYVSSGMGTEKIALRLFNYPSITLFRLYHN